MEEKELIRSAYKKMYDGMIAKEEKILWEVLDDSFVLVHMTGMRQTKEEFIKAVLNGTLNYFSVEHEQLSVEFWCFLEVTQILSDEPVTVNVFWYKIVHKLRTISDRKEFSSTWGKIGSSCIEYRELIFLEYGLYRGIYYK